MQKIENITLVIPSYKQEKTILKDLESLRDAVRVLPYKFEFIVVVDGFVDKTYEILKKERRHNVRVLGYEENRGKGFAVRYGMMQGKGDVIGFIDAGMDIDPTGISMLINHMIWYDADVIIGSKLHPVSQVRYPIWRKILSWGYRSVIRLLFNLKIRDTQVGVKLFRKKVVKDVFPRLLVKRFAFDIEMLAVSYDRGFMRIFEAPIKLSFKENTSSITSGNFWQTIAHMLWDTSAVFYRLKLLRYYNKPEALRKNEYLTTQLA